MSRIRWSVEQVVAQGADGKWSRREVRVVQRFRVCVLDESANNAGHRYGYGQDFEVIVDLDLDLWVRALGSDTPFRKEGDSEAVSLTVVENITFGVVHDVKISDPPGREDKASWYCACGARSRRRNLTAEQARVQADDHVAMMKDRERRDDELAERRRRERELAELAEVAEAPGAGDRGDGR